MSFQLAVFCPVLKRRAAILSLCRSFFSLYEQPCNVVSFQSYDEIIADPTCYDAYLLPVMPPVTNGQLPQGILLAQALRARGMSNPIIFVASSPEWAYEAYRVDALQYLPMPLSRESVYAALARAVEPQHAPVLPVTTPDGIYGIPFSEIEWVECTNHILHFHRCNYAPLRSTTLRVPFCTAIAPLLADTRFMQPHRSYLVNLSAIARLGASEFEMKSGARIPIPRERHASIKTTYLEFLESTLPSHRTR